MAFGEDLEDELGGAVGQREVAELVEDDELGAGVAADDAGELAAALGLLELVGEAGEGGEADAPALLAGADRQRGREHASCRCRESPMKITDSRSSIQEPSASAAIVACGTLGLSAKRKSSRRLIGGKRASIRRRRSRRSARSAISASSSAPR